MSKFKLLAQLNQRIGAMKSARNTYSKTRKLYSSKIKRGMPYSLFEQGLGQRLMNEGYSFGSAFGTAEATIHNLKLSRSGQLKTITRLRKHIASDIQKSIAPLKKQTEISHHGYAKYNLERIITAKGKGVRFIRKNGRIIPIRPRK